MRTSPSWTVSSEQGLEQSLEERSEELMDKLAGQIE